MKIRTYMMTPEITVSKFQRLKEVVDFNPAYQREGEIWKVEMRSRLVDSIINGLDLPKLYFEKANTRRLNPDGLTYQYAVIDGKQRLEALVAFLDGDLRLADDFWFFEDRTVEAAGLNLAGLSEKYPELAQRFLDYTLPIVTVETDSGDLIEEMFQRLNASSALNSAERRNALAGPTKDAANALALHELLVKKSPIKSLRYKHRELGAKFLAIEHQVEVKKRIVDTKADTLYDLFTATRGANPEIKAQEMTAFKGKATETLDRMLGVFEENDRLLASIGTVIVYYIVFRDAEVAKVTTRSKLQRFEDLRREAAGMAEDDKAYTRAANARLREYNVFVQSTNDGRALARRAQILSSFVIGYNADDELSGLDGLTDGELPEHEDIEEEQ